jgi:hypothetical protein
MLSIIVPASKDEPNSLFGETLKLFYESDELEIIFVSKSEADTRAGRLNIGFHRSKGELILFHHPRSFIEEKGIRYLINLSKDINLKLFWGGFTHQFDRKHFLLSFTSWYSNRIRAKLKSILYLDHCIFFTRDLWKNDLPDMEIFEDTILSQYFKKYSKPKLLPFISETSSIRFEKNGVLYQLALNQVMKLCFFLGVNHKYMNQIYEKKIKLNS